MVHSLSLDNGAEFAEFRELEEQLKAPILFAKLHKRGKEDAMKMPMDCFVSSSPRVVTFWRDPNGFD